MAHEHILKISRLEGLTDGIFAIAMTILILDLRLPTELSQYQMSAFLTSHILEKLFIYAGSFIILGTLWVAMGFQIGALERLNRQYLWTHIFYLMVVCVIPFSANLLGSYPNEAPSILFYSINLLFASLAQFIIAECSKYYNLNKDIFTPAIRTAIVRRIFVAPPFYLAAIFLAYWNVRFAFFTIVVPTIVYMIPGRVDKYDKE